MPNHIANRDTILKALGEDLVGPSPRGQEIDCGKPIQFRTPADSYGPWRQAGSGEEILQRDAPTKRYGVGVLYPVRTRSETEETAATELESMGAGLAAGDAEPGDGEEPGVGGAVRDPLKAEAVKDLERVAQRAGTKRGDVDQDDFGLSAANSYKPGTMAISFLGEFPDGAVLRVEASGGRYTSKTVEVADGERTWWLRSPAAITCEFPAASLSAKREMAVPASSCDKQGCGDLDLRVEVFSRPYGGDRRLVTVCLVNRTQEHDYDRSCLFQSSFEASISLPSGGPGVLPYPGALQRDADAEERSLALLYRRAQTYAVGHGCAADWSAAPGSERATAVSARCLPVTETPSITPDISREDGTPIEVPMAPLAGLKDGDDGLGTVSEVIDLYERWIGEKRDEIASLDGEYREAAARHMEECARSAERMREGLAYLRSDGRALRAFQLANHAILLQQVRARLKPRDAQYDPKAAFVGFPGDYPNPGSLGSGNRGKWRAFQIAFLMAGLKSAADGSAPDRRTVELIWFPTGGGKTEAYLGLAAYAMFMRRLEEPGDDGVHVLMRYTLRLLTAQQFQRASGLLCAMEHLRRKNADELGPGRFSIGIWLGQSTTPNTREEARSIWKDLEKGSKFTENKFVLTRCPWCAAQMGPVNLAGKGSRKAPKVIGYEPRGSTVVFKCPDNRCEFRKGLPVYVVDEDIYEDPPSMVIGTVDKFAMLAWRPEARALFGMNPDGEREKSPPGLIIQDELHLISGPLGSMVGLYETVIEELCTDRRGPQPVAPKIVSSTATIRRYADQIKALYGRGDVALFPPPGLDAGDSFFARYARDGGGGLRRGRMYVGVHAPALGSLQTAQVRTSAALLQAPVPLAEAERDPWWTLLTFFNSLRELGNTLSLFQSDIPDRLLVLRNRLGLKPAEVRGLWHIRELTGRLRSEEVPGAIAALEESCTDGGRPVDVCLASNIIEVGIDIDRLSLMAVVGQPKTTSQYIQVTGRVGRSWWERPGLVVTVYGASKPRDRSHFEKFRSYHERLYAQVEPTSVTPFSPPALDRALHAVMASYARQQGDEDLARNPNPYPEALMGELRRILSDRVRAVDPEEAENFEKVFDKRERQWRQWEHISWDRRQQDEDIPLLRPAGAYASRERALVSWSTPQSMRNVDAQCEAEITLLYMQEGDKEDA